MTPYTKLLVTSLAAAGLGASAVAPPVNPIDVIRKSVVAVESNWKETPKYSFTERSVQSKKDGAVTIKTYEVLMIAGSPYRRLLAINDKPIDGGQRADEDQRMLVEVAKREHESARESSRRIAKYNKGREQEQSMIRKMVDAFDFRLSGEDKIGGRECWVLDIGPKPGYRPEDREGKVLAGMSGRLWIDKAEHQWVKAQAKVIRPVRLYGFLARVDPGTRFLLEQEPVENHVWMPKHFNMQVNASALGFVNEDSRDDETYSNYRPAAQILTELEGKLRVHSQGLLKRPGEGSN